MKEMWKSLEFKVYDMKDISEYITVAARSGDGTGGGGWYPPDPCRKFW